MSANKGTINLATAVYEEQDGDFVFTRASKRVKTALNSELEPELAPAPIRGPRQTKRERKQKEATPPTPPAQKDVSISKRQICRSSAQPLDDANPPPNRRTRRNSAQLVDDANTARKHPLTRHRSRASTEQPIKKEPESTPPHPKPTRTRRGRKSKEAAQLPPKQKPAPQPAILEAIEDVGENVIDVILVEEESGNPSDVDSRALRQAGEKIAIPFSDTPVMNRNKEMRRKGEATGRRSSLGMRGRRASSLIENGQAALPHREVNPSEFYKHISDSLLEPRRMRQLLTWCGERALSEKPPLGSENSNVILGGEFFCRPCPLLNCFKFKYKHSAYIDIIFKQHAQYKTRF